MLISTTLIVKLVVGIAFLIVHINLFGKSNLAPTSAMDQIQNYVLGAIIGGVIYNEQITVLQFVFVLITWMLLCMLIKFGKENSRPIKKLIDGSPVMLISHGKVDVATCMRKGVSASDLMLKLRAQGVYEISKVLKAYFEQNGQLTVICYGDETLRLPLIVDGQVDTDVLEAIGHDKDWLENEVKKQGYDGTNGVYIGEYVSRKLELTGYAK
ncbi:DUF421 domain-containing protein [Bifidobacterium sp. ESL0798]|uniref:DUF421 domain-containing protein n=1 Tax=unclassified Bifidobacterium TaxID=2608897 RepID=UPI0023FA1BCE|nr:MULTISPECIES: DUF421 domain-containing protein [unclassified Bifidobacterium]WEV52604.1 DUF421 domain-containing protein [Bifidobacterium sp. ESL0704]WEV74426.1 DUF421 domain-containing protein [Bifidobacterium sp. ESL0798]